jgi:limonene 1,2-monooxygenase
MTKPLRFGTFCPPITRPDRNPTLAISRQLDLTMAFDRLGYDEFFIGEHHNGGWELISSPEIFIATAAERTKHLRFGTGVTPLPYHHPLVVANRMLQLDHITRGRVIMGTGPGSLPSDAHYMGLDYSKARRRAGEALEAIMLLLEQDEPVTMETDWFRLNDAQIHYKPYTYPRFEVSATATVSPTGPRLAGKHGISLLSIAASSPAGFEALQQTWSIVEEEAKEYGKTVSRDGWRLVGFFHLAETEAKAREDVRWGWRDLIGYLAATTNIVDQLSDIDDFDTTIDELNASGLMVIGTPDQLIERIDALQRQTGGFGSFLGFSHEMADHEQTLKSHELMMRDVAPIFQGSVQRQQESYDRMRKGDYVSAVSQAQAAAAAQYEAVRAAR